MLERQVRKPEPILCRKVTPEVSSAIDALIVAGVYRSRDQGLADFAEKGLRAKLESEPNLREMISLAKQLRQIGTTLKDTFPQTV